MMIRDASRNSIKELLNCVESWWERTDSGNLLHKVQQTIAKNFGLKDTMDDSITADNGRSLGGKKACQRTEWGVFCCAHARA